jgi:FkbM family methyltransferase
MKHIDGWWCPEVLSGPGKFLRRSAVIPYALGFWQGPRRRVIQAGAHIGVWPRQLAQYFEAVVCVEPEPENWACLEHNTKDTPRITCLHGALGAQAGTVDLSVQPHSSAGHHVSTRLDRPYATVPQYAIDDWGYEDVSAVFLDVEGYESHVLAGAMLTLDRCHPLLVVEENSCGRKYGIEDGAVGTWLGRFWGYKRVGTFGEDSIYLPATQSREPQAMTGKV